jgi:hypothetical protein
MSERKVYQVLRGLDQSEISKFEAYLRGDNRAAARRLWKFYLALRKNVLQPEPEGDALKEAEAVVVRVLEEPNADEDLAFRRWCNKLLKKLHAYLVDREIELLPDEMRGLLLLRAYDRRGMEGPFAGLYSDFESKISKMHDGDLYYDLKFKAGQVAIEINNPGGSINRERERDYTAHLNDLDQFYLFHLARLNMVIVTTNKALGREDPPWHPEIMWELAGAIDRKKHPGIDIFLSLIELRSKETSEDKIFAFEEKFRDIHPRLEQVERYVLYQHLLSLGQGLINRGREDLNRKVLEMQIFGLENGFIFGSGKMDWKIYRTIIIAALNLGEIDLATNIIEKYEEDLWYDYDGQKEALGLLLRAKICLETGRYEEAMTHLNFSYQNYKLNDVMLELDFRTTRLQAQFHLKQWESGLSSIDSFRMYVQNYDDLFTSHTVLVMKWRQKWFRRLFRLGSGTNGNIPKWLEELDANPNYRLKHWFRDQLESFAESG